MIKILNRPCIDYALDLISLQNFKECALVLKENSPLKERLEKESFGIKITPVPFSTYPGTAGALKACEGFDFENVLIMPGDVVCDFSFDLAFEFHKRKKALVTVITTERKSPVFKKGVISNKHQRVVQLLNRPLWEQVTTNSVATGIYIVNKKVLDYIPEGCFNMFSQLLPLLLNKNEAVFEYPMKGYFNGLESFEEYKECNFSMLAGEIACLPQGRKRGKYPLKTIAPFVIGQGLKVKETAFAGPNAVIGNNCYIGKNARLLNCIVGDNVVIGEGAVVSGIVEDNVTLRPYAQLKNGSVAARGSVIGLNSTVSEGVVVFPKVRVGDGLTLSAQNSSSFKMHGLFEENKISGDMQTSLTPLFGVKLGEAVGNLFKNEVMVGTPFPSLPFYDSFCAGLSSKGVRVIKAQGSVNEVRHAAFKNFCPCVFVGVNGNIISAFFFCAQGLPLSFPQKQIIENAFYSLEKSFCSIEEQKPPQEVILGNAYKNKLLNTLGRVNCKVLAYGNKELCEIFESAVNSGGGSLGKDIEFEFSDNGMDIKVSQGGSVADKLSIILLLSLFENSKALPLPLNFPSYLLNKLSLENVSREDALETHPYFYDNLFMGARLLNIMNKTGLPLNELLKKLPSFGIVYSKVENKSRAKVISHIRELVPCQSAEDMGISIAADSGVVKIVPSSLEESFKIFAYAGSLEAARELCKDMCDILKSIDIN